MTHKILQTEMPSKKLTTIQLLDSYYRNFRTTLMTLQEDFRKNHDGAPSFSIRQPNSDVYTHLPKICNEAKAHQNSNSVLNVYKVKLNRNNKCNQAPQLQLLQKHQKYIPKYSNFAEKVKFCGRHPSDLKTPNAKLNRPKEITQKIVLPNELGELNLVRNGSITPIELHPRKTSPIYEKPRKFREQSSSSVIRQKLNKDEEIIRKKTAIRSKTIINEDKSHAERPYLVSELTRFMMNDSSYIRVKSPHILTKFVPNSYKFIGYSSSLTLTRYDSVQTAN
jgi:hypothetical protein